MSVFQNIKGLRHEFESGKPRLAKVEAKTFPFSAPLKLLASQKNGGGLGPSGPPLAWTLTYMLLRNDSSFAL